jgi:hypothetical protein
MMEIIILCFILIRLSQGVYVQTQYGWVQGVQTEEAIVFYGIKKKMEYVLKTYMM